MEYSNDKNDDKCMVDLAESLNKKIIVVNDDTPDIIDEGYWMENEAYTLFETDTADLQHLGGGGRLKIEGGKS